jgi:succinyl-CoA synthetase beta subunit
MIGDWMVARLNGDQTAATVAATNGEDFNPADWLDANGNAITEEIANAADILLVAGSQEGVFWENS